MSTNDENGGWNDVKEQRESEKVTNLILVHTERFCLIVRPEMQTRDEVDCFGNDDGHDECVSAYGTYVGELDVELLPIVVHPASRQLKQV